MEHINTMTAGMTAAIDEHLEPEHIRFSRRSRKSMTCQRQIHQASAEQLVGVRHVLDAAQDVVMLIDHNLESSQQVVQAAKELSAQ